MTVFRCPTRPHPQDTRTERFVDRFKGCGAKFEEPKARWVTCPQCGLTFSPELEPRTITRR